MILEQYCEIKACKLSTQSDRFGRLHFRTSKYPGRAATYQHNVSLNSYSDDLKLPTAALRSVAVEATRFVNDQRRGRSPFKFAAVLPPFKLRTRVTRAAPAGGTRYLRPRVPAG
eukprot:2097506-Rhodomonas_salina.3